jgi:hypothetical protein
MLRSPASLARLLLLASAASLASTASPEEPRAAAAAPPQGQPQAEGTAKAQEPGAPAVPSLSPRLAAPDAPRSTPSAASGGREKGGAAPPAAPAGPVLTVAEISEDAVRLAGPNIGLAPKQVGRVIARDGTTVGRIEIERVLENGAVGRVVSGRENVAWGARVRFDAQAKR